MGSNRFGHIFTWTTWGESHGLALGVVIDGCPAYLELTEEDINAELRLRRPHQNGYTSPRKEEDKAQILSGVFENKTTGAPISIIIFNQDVDSSPYEALKNLYRPGHANFTYLEKYGICDYRGGGRSSGRETLCRVAAGAVAKKLLKHFDIDVVAYVKQIGSIEAHAQWSSDLRQHVQSSPLFCPDPIATSRMISVLGEAKESGDSLGGVVELKSSYLPVGLGDPVYEKLEANLAKAMLSIPATKGIEFGSGFAAALMKGSEHNDLFTLEDGDSVRTLTNHAGGTLGGISTGMPLELRVVFKPTSSITQTSTTLTLDHLPTQYATPAGSRHDPCIAIRAVPVVEAMAALVLADALLLKRASRL
jgi:chorismate synthase